MTTPMPRCSCGCGERLTEADLKLQWYRWRDDAGPTPATWSSSTCLTEHRMRLARQKAKDGSKAALERGLVPAPRRKPDPKRGTCEKCERWRNVRPHVVAPDETLLLCKECVP